MLLSRKVYLLILLFLSGLVTWAAPLTQRNTQPSEPLIQEIIEAIAKGDIDTVRKDFGDSIDPNFTFADQKTPLTASSAVGNAKITDFLISLGADPKKGDQRGMTPLHYASLYGRDAVIPILVKAGADINAKDFSGLTPLHCAATGNSETTLKTLLALGADPKAVDAFGATPLKMAEMNEDAVAIKILKMP